MGETVQLPNMADIGEESAHNAQARANQHVIMEIEESQPNKVDHETSEIRNEDWASFEWA